MLSEEETKQLKEQLISQIERTDIPNKEEVKDSISNMNESQLEEFLKQNNIQYSEKGEQEQQKCIFCSIVFGDIPSTKIRENEIAIAILELNPISKGHVLIIPKEHLSVKENLHKKVDELAKEVAEQIKKTLKPKEVIIANGNMFGHEFLNVVPVYDKETMDSPRQKTSPEELRGLQESLEKKQEPEKIEEQKIEEISENLWLPKRIP